MPVAVYPKEYVNRLRSEVDKLKDNIKSGKKPVFDNIDSLIKDLEED